MNLFISNNWWEPNQECEVSAKSGQKNKAKHSKECTQTRLVTCKIMKTLCWTPDKILYEHEQAWVNDLDSKPHL